MIKPLRLPDAFLNVLRKRLQGSLGLGGYVERRIVDGEVWVWAPEALKSVTPGSLAQDIFYPEPFDIQPVLANFIRKYLGSDRNRLFIADTAIRRTDVKPEALQWFSVDSLHEVGRARICGFVKGDKAENTALEELLAVASPYPTTLLLTATEPGRELASGMHLDTRSALLTSLLDRTQHVMTGVFDERSMMFWSRHISDA